MSTHSFIRRPLYLVGHSAGARAALHALCRPDMRSQLPRSFTEPSLSGMLKVDSSRLLIQSSVEQGLVAFAVPPAHAAHKRSDESRFGARSPEVTSRDLGLVGAKARRASTRRPRAPLRRRARRGGRGDRGDRARRRCKSCRRRPRPRPSRRSRRQLQVRQGVGGGRRRRRRRRARRVPRARGGEGGGGGRRGDEGGGGGGRPLSAGQPRGAQRAGDGGGQRLDTGHVRDTFSTRPRHGPYCRSSTAGWARSSGGAARGAAVGRWWWTGGLRSRCCCSTPISRRCPLERRREWRSCAGAARGCATPQPLCGHGDRGILGSSTHRVIVIPIGAPQPLCGHGERGG